jgi:hypothetical protein
MKQVGVFLLVMAALGLIAMVFQLQGTFWETLSFLVLMGAFAFIPSFKKVLVWKIHWRLALFAAVICTVIALWQLMDSFLGNYRQFAMPATLIVLSLLAFLFHFLDRRDA